MKGVLSQLIDYFMPENIKFKLEELKTSYSDLGLLYFDENIGKNKIINKNIFEIGMFSKSVLNQLSIKKPIYYIDINLDLFFQLINKKNIKYKSVARFPSVRRDLSILVDKDIPYDAIESNIFNVSGDILKDIMLFDVYQGDKLEKDKKSFAISFFFQDQSTTLMDSQVDKEILKIFQSLVKEFNISLRDGEL
tara:strand:- start:203 stop:781 length:579 start_codon:yes stop_codon:yes gene_type:complete